MKSGVLEFSLNRVNGSLVDVARPLLNSMDRTLSEPDSICELQLGQVQHSPRNSQLARE